MYKRPRHHISSEKVLKATVFEDDEDENETDYNETSCFHTSEIEEEIVQQGVFSIVSQYNSKRSEWIIEPDSSFKMYWDIMNFILIIYQTLVTPYRICFDVPATGFYFYLEAIMDLIFLIDIVISFNSGFYEKGVVILERK